MLKVYLGGPIRGLLFEEAIDWRSRAIERLSDLGFICLSPMRGKELIKDCGKITDSYEDLKGYSSKDIFNRDKFDVSNSDILLLNLTNRKVAIIGSLFELAWGNLLGKYCVVVIEKDSVYAKHPFVKESASIIFEEIDEAIDYLGMCFSVYNK